MENYRPEWLSLGVGAAVFLGIMVVAVGLLQSIEVPIGIGVILSLFHAGMGLGFFAGFITQLFFRVGEQRREKGI